MAILDTFIHRQEDREGTAGHAQLSLDRSFPGALLQSLQEERSQEGKLVQEDKPVQEGNSPGDSWVRCKDCKGSLGVP